MVASINTAGSTMPPMAILRGKTCKALLSFKTQDASVGTLWMWQEKAWMNGKLGVKWFTDVFLRKCGSSRPQVLIMD